MRKNSKIFFLFIALMATIACTIFVGGPDIPNQPIPVSAEAVTAMHDEIKAAVEAGAISGEITLRITEIQLTSYLALKFSTDKSPLFTDPQVYLRDGQMRIYGKAKRGVFVGNVGIVLEVGVDENGRPKLQLVSADFGPLKVPDGLNSAITAIIEEAYTGSLGPVATGLRIESITIADGVLTIVGRIH